MWRTITRYGQPLLLGVIGISLFLWGYFSTSIYFLDLKQVLGISLALFSGIAIYFDDVLHKLLTARLGLFEHKNLNDAIVTACNTHPNVKHIRIFAVSSSLIQPILRSIGTKVDKCTILLYSIPNSSIDSASSEVKHEMNIESVVRDWKHFRDDGFIRELFIWRYNFFPTEYYLVFDDRNIIVGHYLINENRAAKCDVQEPFTANDNSPEGKLLINKYINVFDTVVKSNKSQAIQL